MANYFATLPAYKTGPGIDFSPVGNALDGITAQNNANRQAGLQRNHLELQQRQSDRADQEQQYQHGRNDKQDQLQQVQMFGKQAAAVDQMEGPQRVSTWSAILAKRGASNLTPEELDPVTGPKLMMAQAGQFIDPLDRRTKEAQLGLIEAQTAKANKGTEDPSALRLRQLAQAGVDPESPEGRGFLLTGNYTSKPVYTPAETALDKSYAKSYEADVANGGLADAQKNLTQLKGVRDELENPKGANLTGSILGRVPDFVAAYTNPKAIDARERVEEVVQRNLRLVLGAQFTQNEGFALIKRAYNPTLDEATNAKRLNRLISAMDQALEAKKSAAQYFEQNGTLKGFKGKLNYTIEDFDDAMDSEKTQGRVGEIRHNSGDAPPQSRPRAVNPQTGQEMEFDGQNWIEVR